MTALGILSPGSIVLDGIVARFNEVTTRGLPKLADLRISSGEQLRRFVGGAGSCKKRPDAVLNVHARTVAA